MKESTRRRDGHPVPHSERAARPARVDEPHAHPVPVELVAEEPRIGRRRLRQERGTEASGEGGLRFRDADLGSGELRRETGEEPVHRLVAGQPCEGRQHGERVGREEDDRARMTRAFRGQRVRDPLELVRGAGVLRLRVVVEVDEPGVVDRDVLEDRPERSRRAPDLGLCLGGEPDHLCVAAALDVEDAARAPPVLVVADQGPVGVGRQRGLAGARKTEEERHAAVLAHVCGAMHRQHALERQAVVHHREDRFLDLACVERTADQHLAPRRVQHDERACTGSVLRGRRLELRRVEDERVDREPLELARRGHDEHRLCEQRVVRARGDDADPDAVIGVRAREVVDHVESLLRSEVVGDLRPKPSNRSSASGRLTSPHQIRSREPGSSTMNLSSGERPVKRPVSTTSAPPCASRPSPRASACV